MAALGIMVGGLLLVCDWCRTETLVVPPGAPIPPSWKVETGTTLHEGTPDQAHIPPFVAGPDCWRKCLLMYAGFDHQGRSEKALAILRDALRQARQSVPFMMTAQIPAQTIERAIRILEGDR